MGKTKSIPNEADVRAVIQDELELAGLTDGKSEDNPLPFTAEEFTELKSQVEQLLAAHSKPATKVATQTAETTKK